MKGALGIRFLGHVIIESFFGSFGVSKNVAQSCATGLYTDSNTTVALNGIKTTPIPIQVGTIQGDTLSPPGAKIGVRN